MIPILFASDATEFDRNGIGRLSDCISCKVTEERNGIYECEFEYPCTGIHYEEIIEGRIIGVIHDDSKIIEPFDIYKRSAEVDGVVTFYAHHISYRLTNVILKPFTADSAAATMAALVGNSINANPFHFSTDKAVSGNYVLRVPTGIRGMLCGSEGSILDVYGTGEYEFTRWDVKLWLHRGQYSGVVIRYGKNLVDVEKEYDISNRYNAVVPYWSNDEEVITIPEEIIISPRVVNTGSEVWTNENGIQITDENGTPIVFDFAATNAVPMDLSGDFDEVPTVDQLREKAAEKLERSGAWLPDENISVDFVALWQTEEYKNVAPLQRVKLCDTVSVIYPEIGLEAIKAKVIRVEYDVLREIYTSMELGDARSSFAEVVTDSAVSRISRTIATKGFLQASLEQATKLIRGGLGGYVVINANADGQPQEILIMDTDNIETAVNLIRINKNGIGFSQDGYNGTFSSAWTIDNVLNMEEINVIGLTADLIRAGTLQSIAGGSTWNLETGVFRTTSGRRSIQMENGRIDFYRGDTLTGRIAPVAWGNDYDNSEGTAWLAGENAKYIGIGHRFYGTNGVVYAASDFVVNNGLDPDGYTERMIFYGSTRFTRNVVVNNVLPPVDYAYGYCYLGNSEHRFRGIWTAYLYFDEGVYIAYNVGTGNIVTSRPIYQPSDERLKIIREYDDRYDALLERLEPIVYRWKDRPDGADHVGLGARRTEELMRECGLSGFVNPGETYSIDYQELSVMLLHAYQNLKKEHDDLKNQMADVLRRLEKLEG